MTPAPAIQEHARLKRPFTRILVWGGLATFGSTALYSAFALLTGMQPSLFGIPVGLVIGQALYRASGKHGGRLYQVLGVVLVYLAFAFTYAPGLAAIAFRHGVSLPAFVFAGFLTLISPALDAANGSLGIFMIALGMYVAWILARRNERVPN